MINKDILRQPNDNEKDIIDALKVLIVKSNLITMVAIVIITIGLMVFPHICGFGTMIDSELVDIVLWATVSVFFCGGAIVAIFEYREARKDAKKQDYSEWAVVSGIADEIGNYNSNCIIGVIGDGQTQRVKFEIESKAVKQLLKDRRFLVFVHGDNVYAIVHSDGKIMAANSVEMVEDGCCHEDD